MSRKKTLKNVNIIYYASFANNISSLVESNGGRKIFAETIGVKYETIRNWCNGTRFPEGYQLLSIRDKYGISIDALLTSSDPELIYTPKVSESQAEYGACADSLDKWPDDIKNACRQVKKILQSDHPVIKPALLSNLAAFQYSVDKEESQDAEIRKLNQRLKLLEEFHKAKQRTGTDGAASSSTGNEKT